MSDGRLIASVEVKHADNIVNIGRGLPVVVQSMTNSDTSDVEATVAQVRALSEAGSEIVRITVNNKDAARAVARIRDELDRLGIYTPLVGDFHYNGHRLLRSYPDMATALSKYRINPGNVGFGDKKDKHFCDFIELALEHNKPIRIGVNWGSLDQALLAKMLDENSKRDNPKDIEEVMREALIDSALSSASLAEDIGLSADRIIISCKVSKVQELISVYRELYRRCSYPLHLGLTEAGIGSKGIVASTAALSILLQENIGDTIRVSLTPRADEPRTKEVEVAQEILQSLGLRSFVPQVTACPGCGRTSNSFFQELADIVQRYLREKMPEWKAKGYDGVENMNVAVMGCIVNGPGESKHSDIGISLPGNGENPVAPIFSDGKKIATLRGNNIASEFISYIDEYVASKYGRQ